MGEKEENLQLSKPVLEFVTVANEYCKFMEELEEWDAKDFISTCHKLLPFIYMKGTLLPKIEENPEIEDITGRYVTEELWNTIHNTIEEKLGKFNSYKEIINPDDNTVSEPYEASIAENLADIYQDLKDFTFQYESGEDETKLDAIIECYDNFKHYWGKKLLNALRAIHILLENNQFKTTDKKEQNTTFDDMDTSNWILSKKQQEFRDEED